jgi:hypothetical protein
LITAILNILTLGVIVFAWYRTQTQAPLRRFFFISLVIKLSAGIAVGLVYQYYYKEGDVLYLFQQGKLLRQMLLDAPLDFWNFPHTGVRMQDYYFGEFKDLNSRVVFFSKIVALINLLTFNNFWLTSIWFSFISFAGFWYGANVLARLFPYTKISLFLSFFLLPSVVFWSSGLLKESIICGSVCIVVGSLLSILHLPHHSFKIRILEWLFLFFFSWIIWKIKYYYTIILTPICIAYFCIYTLNKRYHLSLFAQLSIFGSFFLFLALLGTFTNPNFHLDYFLIAIKDSYDTIVETTDADNLIYFIDFDGSIAALIKNIPFALFAGLFEPLLWEAEGNLPKVVTSMENLFLYSLLFFVRPPSWKIGRHTILLFACILYIFLITIFLTFSTPSIGSLVRYKAGFLPFWAYLISFKVDFRRFKNLLRKYQTFLKFGTF